jgi:WhiB family redox-sensing transcriptional regulator
MAAIARLPMPIQETYEWQYDGACRGADPEIFFSPDAERGTALCAVCPVVQQCLDHALTVREPYGTWGGLTINERDQLLRESA